MSITTFPADLEERIQWLKYYRGLSCEITYPGQSKYGQPEGQQISHCRVLSVGQNFVISTETELVYVPIAEISTITIQII